MLLVFSTIGKIVHVFRNYMLLGDFLCPFATPRVSFKCYVLLCIVYDQIVAAILCDTGIALLAYMDGITGSSTLGGVVLAACAAAGFAIFKVNNNSARFPLML